MRILLIEPYGEVNKIRRMVPVGIPYIAAVLIEAGHDVEGFNANTSKLSYEKNIQEILTRVKNGNFDMVGMGGLCMSFPFQKELFNRLAALEDRPLLISGGNMFTSEPEFCMQEYGVDYGIFGEGEIPFTALLTAIQNGDDITGIGGLYYRDGDTIRSTKIPGEVVEDLDTIPYPAYDLFYSDDDIRSQNQVSVYTSRSCPFSCTFCYHPAGSRYRRRSVDHVIAEIQYVYDRYGVASYSFGDELFLVDEQWVLSFCDKLEKLGFMGPWACQTRASHVEPHILKRIKEAGCKHVRVGIESGSDRILKSMNKKTTRENNFRAIKNIREAGMNMDGGIILGDFAETPETIRETVEFVKETDLTPNQGINFIVPFPGSGVWERCLKENLITDKEAFLEALTKPAKLRINMTTMSDRELLGMQEWGAMEIFTHLATNRRAIIEQTIETNDIMSKLLTRCPSCGTKGEYTLHGMRLEMLCNCAGCKKPLLFNPLEVPHFENRSARFRDAVARIDETGPRDILVTPSCLDFIRLSAIGSIPMNRIMHFLDKSGPKAENDYFGISVLPRDRDIVAKLGAKQLYIVNGDYCEAIHDELKEWDIPGLEIIPLFE